MRCRTEYVGFLLVVLDPNDLKRTKRKRRQAERAIERVFEACCYFGQFESNGMAVGWSDPTGIVATEASMASNMGWG